jgi:hypothetical protein
MDGKLWQLAPSIENPLQFNHGWTIQKKISHNTFYKGLMYGKIQQLAPSIESPLQFNHEWTIQKVIRFHKQHKQGVCHIVALPFTLKKYRKKAKER